MDNNIVMIESLFTSRGEATLRCDDEIDTRAVIDSAEVIFMVDVMSGTETLVYGKELLREVIASGEPYRCPVLRVGVDVETGELEKLLALVGHVKGSDDYRRTEDAEA